MYTVNLVPSGQVREVWKYVKDHLYEAIEASNGRWSPEYVLASLVLNEQSLWVICDTDTGNGNVVGAATTQIISYPEKRMLAIHFLGGDGFPEWYAELLKVISEHAKKMGCEGIECLARFGFWKWFKNDGFEKTSVFYERAV